MTSLDCFPYIAVLGIFFALADIYKHHLHQIIGTREERGFEKDTLFKNKDIPYIIIAVVVLVLWLIFQPRLP